MGKILIAVVLCAGPACGLLLAKVAAAEKDAALSSYETDGYKQDHHYRRDNGDSEREDHYDKRDGYEQREYVREHMPEYGIDPYGEEYERSPTPYATCSMGVWGPPTGPCVRNDCFSGDTRVRIRESGTPVAMRDLKTGQHVQCLNTNEDLRLPTTTSYCKVMNWLHAEEISFPQTRINFTRPSGAGGSITVSTTHLMLKLIDASVGDTSRRVDLFGAFDTIAASRIAPGDKLAVLTDDRDPSAGFIVVAAATVEEVEAAGKYVPMVATPYIIAEGMVAPLYPTYDVELSVPPGMDGAGAAYPQYVLSPLFMAHLQPLGTPGTQGQWDGNPLWPGLLAYQAARRPHSETKALDFMALRDWFLPRLAQWKANESAAMITADDVISFVGSGDVWLPPPQVEQSAHPITDSEDGHALVGCGLAPLDLTTANTSSSMSEGCAAATRTLLPRVNRNVPEANPTYQPDSKAGSCPDIS